MRRKFLYDTDNYIKITFNVTSTTTQTRIVSSDFSGGDQIAYVTFNTPHALTKYDYSPTYQFTYTGTRIGYLHFKEGATSLESLFANITILTEIDLNHLDTSEVTSMSGMCMGCTNVVQILMSECRADNLTSMVNTFNSCTSLKYIDFGSYISGRFKPTAKLTDIRNLFNWCKVITSINMSMFDCSGVTLWGYTWGNCYALKELYLNTALNASGTYTTNMFVNSTASGAKLYYNSNHSFTKIANVLGSNWTLTPYNYGT